MNLLDYFVLQHVQITALNAELVQPAPGAARQDAKVELNLTPRLMKGDVAQTLPAYHVSARLACQGKSDAEAGPMFTARVGFESVYQQVSGDPIDLAQFTRHHASLTRQLYPLLQHDLRALLARLGLEKIQLPYDLAARLDSADVSVQCSGALH